MCFSATASFAAGGALTAGGVLTLSKAKTKKELPFASIPILFGIQQIIEGVVWLSFGSATLNTVATYSYSVFSHSLWPILVPISVFLIETDHHRKNILKIFCLVGLIVGLYLLYFIFANSVKSSVIGGSIAYQSPHLYTLLIMAMYITATCGSCLFSSHKMINIFGATALIGFIISAWFFIETFLSVWCFFSAVLSILIYWHFKNEKYRIH